MNKSTLQNKVQLITYAQRLGKGTISYLQSLLASSLEGQFGAVHILPFYDSVDGADTGFDPKDHTNVDPNLGTWKDIKNLAQQSFSSKKKNQATIDLMADLIVNHVSSESEEFKDYLLRGNQSKYKELFLSYSDVFPMGASEQDLLRIYRPRPGLPLTKYTLKDGSSKFMWTTFTPQQIDINVFSKLGQHYLNSILTQFQKSGISIIRLDAVGYAVKKAGSSCFMTQETFDFIDQISKNAHSKHITVLLEIHSYYKTQIEIAKKVDLVYDFCLPPLILYAFSAKDAGPLVEWLKISPKNAISVLDTHDGIGIIDIGPSESRPGLLNASQIDQLVESIHTNCKGESKLSTGAAASNLDLYQVNATYYSALANNDTKYLLARLIQFFSPGIPQVYYVGYFAGANDLKRLAETKVGREINRQYFSEKDIQASLNKPVVKYLQALINFRNSHPSFGSPQSFKQNINSNTGSEKNSSLAETPNKDLFDSSLTLDWNQENRSLVLKRSYLDHFSQLTINFSNTSFELLCTDISDPKKALYKIDTFEKLQVLFSQS